MKGANMTSSLYNWSGHGTIVEDYQGPETIYLEWDEKTQLFVTPRYKLSHRYLQPSHRCPIHQEEVSLCALDPYHSLDQWQGYEWRIDSETGECMNAGWMFEMGEAYIADEDRAEALCQRLWNQNIEEAYEDSEENGNGEAFFYTEW